MTQVSPAVQNPAFDAAVASRPALAAMFAMLDRKELLADTAIVAARSETSDYTNGVLAGLALAGQGELGDLFTATVVRTAAALAGFSFDDMVASVRAHRTGA